MRLPDPAPPSRRAVLGLMYAGAVCRMVEECTEGVLGMVLQ